MNVCDVKIELESMIGDVPLGVGYISEKCGLISLDDSYIGLSSTSTQFYSVRPPWFQHCFITLRCVIPTVCVTNKREESVVNEHN